MHAPVSAEVKEHFMQMAWNINDFEKNVDELTLEKSKNIISSYFPKDKLQFVLIGKASDIKTIAEKYGPVKEVDIKD